MAKKKTIGILAALVTADAAQLRKEFASVDNTIRRSTTSWQRQLKGGLKLGLGIAGAQGALSALTGEIRHVIANVEKIPGINPQAVASIVEARTEFAKFRQTIDAGIASALHFGIEFSKAIGAGAAMLAGASGDDVAAGLTVLETPDDIAAAQDPNFEEKRLAARARLAEAQKKRDRATMSDAEQIIQLRKEAIDFEENAMSRSKNAVQILEARIEATQRATDAEGKFTAMKKELKAAEEKLKESTFGAARAKLTDAQAIEGLQARVMGLQIALAELYRLQKENPQDPLTLQVIIDKTKELAEANKGLEKGLDRVNKRWEQMGEGIAESFENAVFSGGSLRDMLKGIEADLIKIMLRTAITEPLGKLLGGGLSKIFGGFFAEGGRPPMGKASIVGERGPELFVPDGSGTIVPFEANSGQSGKKIFYIDARGADRTGLARLEAMIRELNGSIEPRAVGAVMDFRRRGAAA